MIFLAAVPPRFATKQPARSHGYRKSDDFHERDDVLQIMRVRDTRNDRKEVISEQE